MNAETRKWLETEQESSKNLKLNKIDQELNNNQPGIA